MCKFRGQSSALPGCLKAWSCFSLTTSWLWDGSCLAGMAALGPAPEFGESVARGYSLVPPIRAN